MFLLQYSLYITDKKIFLSIPSFQCKEEVTLDINKNLLVNTYEIKEILKDCDDVIYREITAGGSDGINMMLIYIDGMTDKKLISDYAVESLIHNFNPQILDEFSDNEILSKINHTSIAITEIKTIHNVLVGL